MVATAAAFDPALVRQVAADSLEPHQLPTPAALKTASNFSAQVMLKHPFLSEFHHSGEHLHAGLLEADPGVISYVPQPFRLRVRQRWYTPDCYVVSDRAPRRVLELKPGGELAEDLRVPLTQFFAQHGLQFEVISYESVYAREVEAENWLEIVRILHQARDLGTTQAEQTVLEILDHRGPCALGEVIDPGDRNRTYLQEIALLRLLHQGHVSGALSERALDFDTEFSLCT